jgi:AraC family transcriptional regulator
MRQPRLIERPAFQVVGKKTWISGQDNTLFGRFWQQCQAEGLLERFEQLGGLRPGPQTGGVTLGVSCVEQDPSKREFHYLIGIEHPEDVAGLETYPVPAARWAVFACHGKVPESIVQAELYAFMEWLPNSPYVHAYAPEMEVYPPGPGGESDDSYSEFWLPIADK